MSGLNPLAMAFITCFVVKTASESPSIKTSPSLESTVSLHSDFFSIIRLVEPLVPTNTAILSVGIFIDSCIFRILQTLKLL